MMRSSLNFLPDDALACIFADTFSASGLVLRLVCRRWDRIFESYQLLTIPRAMPRPSAPWVHVAEMAAWEGSLELLEHYRPLVPESRCCDLLKCAAAGGHPACVAEICGWIGGSPEFTAISRVFKAAGSGGSYECLKVLLRWWLELAQKDPGLVVQYGKRPTTLLQHAMIFAASSGQVDLLRKLLGRGEVDACTPYAHVSYGDYYSSAPMYVDCPAHEALACAASGGSTECMTLIRDWLIAGDNYRPVVLEGLTYVAASKGQIACLELVVSWGAPPLTDGLVEFAASGGHFECVRWLCERGLPVDPRMYDMAFIDAACHGRHECLALMHEWRPLPITAIERAFKKTAGARIPQSSALDGADHAECLRLLRSWGAVSPECFDRTLAGAVMLNNAPCLRLLREWGAGHAPGAMVFLVALAVEYGSLAALAEFRRWGCTAAELDLAALQLAARPDAPWREGRGMAFLLHWRRQSRRTERAATRRTKLRAEHASAPRAAPRKGRAARARR